MTDLAAIAAARAAGQTAEADARVLADRLVVAKADRRKLREDLAVLPQRLSFLQRSVADAQVRVENVRQAHAELAPRASAAQARAASADAASAAASTALQNAQEDLDDALAQTGPGRPGGGGRPPGLIAALRKRVNDLTQPAATAANHAAAAHREADALAAQLAAVPAELPAAQAAWSAFAGQAALVGDFFADAQRRQPAVEALPATLSADINQARVRVAAAWAPWDKLLAAVHADIVAAAARMTSAASPEQVAAAAAELERLRGELVAGDSAEDLVALVGADVPLALLPVRLETCFDRHDGAVDLLVRIFPDSVHADSHEPELTADELAWGRRYLEHERATGADKAAALDAWRVLADRFGPQRAAWVARAAAASDPPQRAESWTRAATTSVLPDRWIALGYRDGERRFAVLGRPIADTLAVGPDPGDLGAGDAAAPLGAAAHWLVDFDRAVEQGMALRIALSAADSSDGLDRLVVLGVRATGDGADGARRLTVLLDAHHYTDGLALIAAGAPTNNTSASRSAWTTAGDDRAASLRTERGAALVTGGSDGNLLARALGIAADPLSHAAGAGAASIAAERHMRTALWPVTWGYMLDQLVGELSDDAVAAARAHVIASVAASGALPTVRLGRQPYGVLAVTSLEQWRLLDPQDIDAELPALLRALAPAWRAALPGVRRVTAGADLGAVLAEALAMSPVSLAFAARGLSLPAPDAASFDRLQQALAVLRALEHPRGALGSTASPATTGTTALLDLDPALARAAFDPLATPLTGPFVAAEVSETAALPAVENYIAWLVRAGLDELRGGTPPGGANTLLFALMRHALLRAYATTAVRIVRARGLAASGEGTEPGLGDSPPPPATVWSRLAARLDGVTAATQTLGAHLDAARAAGSAGSSPAAAQLTELLELQASLRHLAGLPSAMLARLAGGALDIASHRLDAWISAHATRRLAALRARRDKGLRLGAYGVLEDVRPTPPEAATHGYIHAPSLGQAATAAVLRSGHLTHQDDTDSPLALDLSSRRVRLALTLLDGIRAGQPLGALLGYRLERGLHEHHPNLTLDRYITALRALAPLDETTKAEHTLRVATDTHTSIKDLLERKQRELNELRVADTLARNAQPAKIAAAQAKLDAAKAQASAFTMSLQTAQDVLDELYERAIGAGPRRRRPPEDDDQIPGPLQEAIDAQSEVARKLKASLDVANRAVADAAALVFELSAGLKPNDDITWLTDEINDKWQPQLKAAVEAVAAARAELVRLRGLEPRVSEALRANNVADGLGLRRRWRTGSPDGPWDETTIPFGDPDAGLPALESAEGQAIDAELRVLDDAVDALSDLLVAESVHQLVQGNPQRAGATVDALSRGDAPPPDVEVVRTPRAGTGVTHRLLVLIDPNARADGWPTDATQVRALVEPALEAWTASVLGPAARVRVRVGYTWPGGNAHSDVHHLGVLGLSALDAVAMAPAGGPAGATPIELMLLDHLAHVRPTGVPAGAIPQLDLRRSAAWGAGELGLGEFFELARSVRELLDGARALDARDLAPPGATTDPGIDGADVAARAAVAARALQTARSQLSAAIAGGERAALRAALARAAKLGAPAAPTALEGAAAALAELDRRARALAAADSDSARIAAVLGDDFRVLARVTSVAGGELAGSLAASAELQGGDELAAVTWLQRAAHVRDGASRLESALLYAQATGSPQQLRLRVAQLPHRPGDRWVGLPAMAGQPILSGRLSLVVQSAAAAPPAAGVALAGLVVDEWTEVIPEPTQLTGIGFHVEQPDARAPQAILLAVAPTEAHVWSLQALEATVLETLDLARIRLVDSQALGSPPLTEPSAGTGVAPRVGHYLPAIYLAAAPASETVTSDLGRVSAPAPAPG